MPATINNLVNKFSGNTETQTTDTPSNDQPNTSEPSNESSKPVTEEPTTHSESAAEAKKDTAPIAADSASTPARSEDKRVSEHQHSGDSANNNPSDGIPKNNNEEASKDGAPAKVLKDGEHYKESDNVKHILEEAEQAEDAHGGKKEGDGEESHPVKEEANPGKHPAERENAQKGEQEMGKVADHNGYVPSSNVKHILEEAEKSDTAHHRTEKAGGHELDQADTHKVKHDQ